MLSRDETRELLRTAGRRVNERNMDANEAAQAAAMGGESAAVLAAMERVLDPLDADAVVEFAKLDAEAVLGIFESAGRPFVLGELLAQVWARGFASGWWSRGVHEGAEI
jgi:hypothetical protein